jgi:hypothetical protein
VSPKQAMAKLTARGLNGKPGDPTDIAKLIEAIEVLERRVAELEQRKSRWFK